MTEAVVVDKRLFTPIRVTEERLEALLSTAAPTIFPGFDYFEFKPAIRCSDSTRHPDGALLAAASREWWVVEVETHLHHATDHIEAQMRDLMGGFYGPDAFAYLDRHDTFSAERYDVDPYEPSFLLIIDSLTPEIRNVAVRMGLHAIECSVYIAPESNQYALAISGHRPQADTAALAPGISLLLEEDHGMALLRPFDGGKMPNLRTYDILIGSSAYQCFAASGRRGIVLPRTVAEIHTEIAKTNRFRLVTSSMRLIPDPTERTTVTIDG